MTAGMNAGVPLPLVILRQADSAGLDFFAFKVSDKSYLDKFEAELKAYGLTVERIPAGELLETGERVRFGAALRPPDRAVRRKDGSWQRPAGSEPRPLGCARRARHCLLVEL